MKPLVHIVTTAFFLAMNLCAAPAFFTVPQPENGKEHEQALKVGHFFETADGAPAKEATAEAALPIVPMNPKIEAAIAANV